MMRLGCSLLITLLAITLCLSLSSVIRPVSARRSGSHSSAVDFIPVRLALKQRDVAGLTAALDAASSPSSPDYSRFLTASDIGQLLGPAPIQIRHLRKWLEEVAQAVPDSFHLHATRDYVDISLPRHIAVEMIGDAAQRQRSGDRRTPGLAGRFAGQQGPQEIVEFAFPAEPKRTRIETKRSAAQEQGQEEQLQFAKRLPSRTERLKRMAHQRKGAHVHPNDASGTPALQRQVYGVPAGLVCTNSSNVQQVWGTGTYGFTASDLAEYYEIMSIDAAESNELVVTDYPGQEGGDNWGEGTLDVSLISAIAPGVLTQVSNTDTSEGAEEGDGFGPAMLLWLTNLVDGTSKSKLPLVISMSLGSLSWDSCNLLCEGVAQLAGQNVTYAQCQAYMQEQRQVCMYPDSAGVDRMDVEFIKLGAMGVTLMAATGDGGSHFSFQFFDSDPIGTLLNQVACTANFPTFPAESSHVVGVGGSDWSNGVNSPQAWGASGGGFSWRYPRPSYQEQAVGNYLRNTPGVPPSSAFNASNRAYPDVATLAIDVPVVFSGVPTPASGTSCSAPEFAALVSLINDMRLNAGFAPLGFLNPVLYALASNATLYPTLFTDMTTGNSDCDSTGECCGQGTGFPAAKGWDPTTGLGQPLFAELSKILSTNDFLDRFQ
jgi:tripeptidyl-peptidase-1